jgi:hypothetical protein
LRLPPEPLTGSLEGTFLKHNGRFAPAPAAVDVSRWFMIESPVVNGRCSFAPAPAMIDALRGQRYQATTFAHINKPCHTAHGGLGNAVTVERRLKTNNRKGRAV